MQISPPSFPGMPLAEIPRGHLSAPPATTSRVIAGALTAALYALLIFLARFESSWKTPDRARTREVVATILPAVPVKRIIIMRPFLAHLIRPHAVSLAPPAFTVASDVPAAPAALTVTDVKSSPLTASPSVGTGVSGQGISASGTNGAGGALSGCWDAAWAQAVSDRVRHFFYYPHNKTPHGQFSDPMRGVVMVHLVVKRDGRLGLLEVGKNSGHLLLDDAAIDMVRKAEPLPRIPDRMHADLVDAELPIQFGMRDPDLKPTIGSCN
ncbi:MAG TPA: cell envelope integrity protein TolA [Rhizomicrobium sp.]|nr:cell envelope integrity protein TolA [Rhizomicrobium sp.]